MERLTVVVPTIGNRANLEKMLTSFSKNVSVKSNFIIVKDGCTRPKDDEIASWVTGEAQVQRIITLPQNQGVGCARFVGTEEAMKKRGLIIHMDDNAFMGKGVVEKANKNGSLRFFKSPRSREGSQRNEKHCSF